MKKFLSAMMVLFLLILAGCGTSKLKKTNTEKENNTRVVKIGVIAPLSGPGSSYGEDILTVYQDAVDRFNKKQNTTKVVLVPEDGKCEGAAALSSYQKLTKVDGVDLIMGGACSSETLSIGPIAQKEKVLILSALSSDPAISLIGNYVYRFRNDASSAITLANYLQHQQEKQIYLFTEKTDYALSLKDKFLSSFKGEILYQEDFLSTEKDFTLLAKKVKKGNAIVVFVQSETTATSIIKAFKKEGILESYKGHIYGAYFFSNQKFLDAVGDLANGLQQVSLGLGDISAKGRDYLQYYKDKYKIKSDDLFVLLDKESIDVILDGIHQGFITAKELQKFLLSIDKNHPRKGYFATYYFNGSGDSVGMDAIIQQIQSGEAIPIK